MKLTSRLGYTGSALPGTSIFDVRPPPDRIYHAYLEVHVYDNPTTDITEDTTLAYISGRIDFIRHLTTSHNPIIHKPFENNSVDEVNQSFKTALEEKGIDFKYHGLNVLVHTIVFLM